MTKRTLPLIQCVCFQQEKLDRGWTKMPWGRHPGSWWKCKRWWYRNRVSSSSETCKAQRKGISGLAKKGFQKWRGRQKNTELLKEKHKENMTGSRSKDAQVRLESQSWMAPARCWKDRLPFLPWSTWGTEKKNCTTAAWAKSPRLWSACSRCTSLGTPSPGSTHTGQTNFYFPAHGVRNLTIRPFSPCFSRLLF